MYNDLSNVKKTILVASGKGGVGKSTVSVNLAVSIAKLGYKVGLFDADIFGPSIPIMMGIVGQQPEVIDLGADMYFTPINKFGVEVISLGNMMDNSKATIWRGPLASKTIVDVIQKAIWKDIDILIIDLPPGTSDIHISCVQDIKADGALIVTTPQSVAISDANKAVDMFMNPAVNVPILGIIENMSYFKTEKLPNDKFYLFGKGGGEILAKKSDTELLAQIPIIENFAELSDNGQPESIIENSISAEVYKDLSISIINKLEISK